MTYKLILPVILLVVCIIPVRSQQNVYDQSMSNSMRMFDANGKLFVNPNPDVAGSPYYIENWKYGILTLQNNDVYSKRLVRINIENQEVHYLSPANVEMSLPAGYIKMVTFIDSAQIPVTTYNFQCGFPSISYFDEKHLYRVVCNGKIKMLQSIRKEIITDKNELTGEINKEYRTYEDYFIFTGSVIERIKKDKTYVLGILKDKKDAIEVYATQNSLNYKLIPDLKKIIDYYNSL